MWKMLWDLETWELWSYVVTVVGLPFAIWLFVFEQRKERENEDEEIFQSLAENYTDFLTLLLDHPDLQLRSKKEGIDFTSEQQERRLILFEHLISLFERAYLLAYEEDMSPKQKRRWASWEDYMREWCERSDFRKLLPQLLQGEDPEFAACIQKIAKQEEEKTSH